MVIERFWRSIKYDAIYLKSYENARELEQGIDTYIIRYNQRRPHRDLAGAVPDEAFAGTVKVAA